MEKTETFFDYGCGLGDDLRGLSALGYTCSGWDPVHKKDGKKTSCHVVNVGFVLNVIENPEDRIVENLLMYILGGESIPMAPNPQLLRVSQLFYASFSGYRRNWSQTSFAARSCILAA